MKHGGDTLSFANIYDGELIDFSTNINPLGLNREWIKACENGFRECVKYPDIYYRALKQKIGAYLNCDVSQVIVGNGAVEIIDQIIQQFERILLCPPCFSEYKDRGLFWKKEIINIKRQDNFKIDVETLEGTIKEGDLIILTNPNNPDGSRIPIDELQRIAHVAKTKKAFLLLDEVFFEFCPEDYDSIKIFKDYNNICILRAATKFFALPGARLGYAFANEVFARHIQEGMLPWNINAFAEEIGKVALSDSAYIQASREYIQEQREFLLGNLQKFKTIKVYHTDCNFILIKLYNQTDEEVFQRLLKRGIFIRKASNFEGLDDHYIRIAVKDYESNVKILEALEEIL